MHTHNNMLGRAFDEGKEAWWNQTDFKKLKEYSIPLISSIKPLHPHIGITQDLRHKKRS